MASEYKQTDLGLIVRIAFIANTVHWGGVKTWCLDMGRSFKQAGAEVFVIGRQREFIDKAHDYGLNGIIRKPGADYSPLAIAFYIRFFKREKIDIAVLNVSKDLRSAGIAARICGIPVVQHIGSGRDFKSNMRTRLDAHITKTNFLCCSAAVLKEFEYHFPTIKQFNRISIHNGTTVPENLPPMPPIEPLRLVSVGILTHNKGQHDLLDAVLLLKNDGKNVHLTIVGSGPEEERLKLFVKQNGLEESVEFTGYSADVPAYLARSHIFVLPSYSEGLCIALEEGLAYGLIPVAREVGGTREIWPSGFSLLNKDATAQDFADAIRPFFDFSASELLSMRNKIHEHAKKVVAQEVQFYKFKTWVEQILAGQTV